MKSFDQYITKKRKENIIFDFDNTLFRLILDWEKYFLFIREKLMKTNPHIYNAYCMGDINWAQMQNGYVNKYGRQLLKLIYTNNNKAEELLIKKEIINPNLVNFIKSMHKKIHFLYMVF